MPENRRQLEDILYKAAKKAGSAPIEAISYKFSPQGIAGLVLVAESHIAIHSWPEYDYTAVDIFTCGRHTKPEAALEYLKEVFGAQQTEIREIKRGERKNF